MFEWYEWDALIQAAITNFVAIFGHCKYFEILNFWKILNLQIVLTIE
jgi:hypothetical protein